MDRFDLSFLHLRFLDIVDIILVAIIIYYLYNLIRGTIAVNIVFGLIIIYLVYIITEQLHMRLLSNILGGFVSVGFLALIIVFQQEIRRFLLLIGKNAALHRNKIWEMFLPANKETENINVPAIKHIIEACKTMQHSRTGALIVFAKFFDDQYYQNTGEAIDGYISKRLIESVFKKNSPLHDGAMVISEGKIKCASCILPVSDNIKLPAQYGLRHRAGIGITELSDAVAVIVSEETGQLAYAKQGRVRMDVTYEDLEKLLIRDI